MAQVAAARELVIVNRQIPLGMLLFPSSVFADEEFT
jgi:hypothetical protein